MGKGRTKQFKHEAMGLMTEQGYTPSPATRELGMADGTLFVWLRKAGWRNPVQDAH